MPIKSTRDNPRTQNAGRPRPQTLTPSAGLDELREMIEGWVAEDVGLQDLTTNVMIPGNAKADFVMNTREEIVIAGIEVAAEVFRHMLPDAKVKTLVADGTKAKKGTSLMRVTGPARGLLTIERTSLNILQFMWRHRSLTNMHRVSRRHRHAAHRLCAKTISRRRMLSKYSAPFGRLPKPHQLRLHGEIIIKDNHI